MKCGCTIYTINLNEMFGSLGLLIFGSDLNNLQFLVYLQKAGQIWQNGSHWYVCICCCVIMQSRIQRMGPFVRSKFLIELRQTETTVMSTSVARS